jgi:hypothetical protein
LTVSLKPAYILRQIERVRYPGFTIGLKTDFCN